VKTASTPRRPTTKNRTRARARRFGVNTRRACIETTAKRTSKPTCTYNNRRRLESCSRDPIGYAGSAWHLYQYVSSNPGIGLDPQGLYQLPWWLARIVAQIPIVNIINAVLQDLPGTDITDYAGCMPDWDCGTDEDQLAQQCRLCVAQSAAINMFNAGGTAFVDGVLGAVIGLIASSVFPGIGAIYGVAHALSAWIADAITIGRALSGIRNASIAAKAAYCTP